MESHSNVYSPLQNTAVWLAAWLHGEEPYDEFDAAFSSLGGPHSFVTEEEVDQLDFLKQVRSVVSEFLLHNPEGQPPIRLILHGPGDPPLLPAGSASALAASSNSTGAIVLHDAQPDTSHVLVPRLVDGGMMWEWFVEKQPLPAPAYLSPGEADYLLADATRAAAALIEQSDYVPTDALPNPRLTVGSLSDFYEAPGLPASVPPRAAKLFARADRVAAIVDTIVTRVGDHSLDPQLIPLWRHIRQARMAGVSYAVAEFGR